MEKYDEILQVVNEYFYGNQYLEVEWNPVWDTKCDSEEDMVVSFLKEMKRIEEEK